MKNITLAFLAAAAMSAVSAGAASALPFDTLPAANGENLVQDVRTVCNQNGRCYNTRSYRSARGYGYRPGYYNNRAYYGSGYGGRGYYGGPGYYDGGYGYRRGPALGIGIGPFGFGVF